MGMARLSIVRGERWHYAQPMVVFAVTIHAMQCIRHDLPLRLQLQRTRQFGLRPPSACPCCLATQQFKRARACSGQGHVPRYVPRHLQLKNRWCQVPCRAELPCRVQRECGFAHEVYDVLHARTRARARPRATHLDRTAYMPRTHERRSCREHTNAATQRSQRGHKEVSHKEATFVVSLGNLFGVGDDGVNMLPIQLPARRRGGCQHTNKYQGDEGCCHSHWHTATRGALKHAALLPARRAAPVAWCGV